MRYKWLNFWLIPLPFWIKRRKDSTAWQQVDDIYMWYIPIIKTPLYNPSLNEYKILINSLVFSLLNYFCTDSALPRFVTSVVFYRTTDRWDLQNLRKTVTNRVLEFISSCYFILSVRYITADSLIVMKSPKNISFYRLSENYSFLLRDLPHIQTLYLVMLSLKIINKILSHDLKSL